LWREQTSIEERRVRAGERLEEERFGLSEEELSFRKREARLTRKEKAEQKKYDRLVQHSDRLLNFFNSEPQIRQNIAQMWRTV
jgi:hypothetical protein